MTPKQLIDGLERGAAILRVLGPVTEAVDKFIHEDGPEPAIFIHLPELKAPAALERARVRSRRQA